MHLSLGFAGLIALYPLVARARDGGERAILIGIPKCAKNGHGVAETIGEVNDESCQNAALQMYKLGADVEKAPAKGCNTLFTQGDCDLFLCDIGDHKQTEITVGVIGTAANLIHAYCRLNGKVGGEVEVEAPNGGKVLVQLGNRPKDELKAREEESNIELAPKVARGRYTPRSDPGDYVQEQGVIEGGAFMADEITIVDLEQLEDAFMENVRFTRRQTNPNWQNTAAARHVINRNGQTLTIAMGFITRRGHTVRDTDPDDRNGRVTFADIINQFLSAWRGAGLRGIYTAHLWRQRPDGGHDDHGDLVIVVEEGRNPLLLPMDGGSQ